MYKDVTNHSGVIKAIFATGLDISVAVFTRWEMLLVSEIPDISVADMDVFLAVSYK